MILKNIGWGSNFINGSITLLIIPSGNFAIVTSKKQKICNNHHFLVVDYISLYVKSSVCESMNVMDHECDECDGP